MEWVHLCIDSFKITNTDSIIKSVQRVTVGDLIFFDTQRRSIVYKVYIPLLSNKNWAANSWMKNVFHLSPLIEICRVWEWFFYLYYVWMYLLLAPILDIRCKEEPSKVCPTFPETECMETKIRSPILLALLHT